MFAAQWARASFMMSPPKCLRSFGCPLVMLRPRVSLSGNLELRVYRSKFTVNGTRDERKAMLYVDNHRQVLLDIASQHTTVWWWRWWYNAIMHLQRIQHSPE